MNRTLRVVLQVVAVSLLALLVGVFAKGLLDNATTVSAEVKDGKRPMAPNFTLDRLDGGRFSLASTRGRPVVLNFWASWCGPCGDEAPILAEIARRYKGRVDVVGVNSQDDIGNARKFAQRYDLGFTLVHDTNVVYHRWGVGGMPETFVIAPSGRVIKHFPGEITGADLDAELAPMLGGGGT